MSQILFKLPRDKEALKTRLEPRKQLFNRELISNIADIFEDVENSGDTAIKDATSKFDNVQIADIRLSEEYIDKCVSSLTPEFRSAINTAISNIEQVNKALLPETYWKTEIREGTVIGEKTIPLDAVGLWVPARKGPLVSTALMLVTAAKVAGVKNILVGMPPQPDGSVNSFTIAAAKLSGADRFVVGNGVAIIAGFSIGTNSVSEVNAIYGPGPQGISAAMSIAFSYGKRTVVGIGPTDCAIIADDTIDPDWLAADLLCEGEHGMDSSAFLVTTSQNLAEKVEEALKRRIPEVDEPRREILTAVFGSNGMGAIALVPDMASACRIVNDYAPEHLMVACSEENQETVLNMIVNSGEILLGNYTPFSAANYSIGITAVLPTNGFAHSFSGITSKDMVKTSTIGSLSKSALNKLRPSIESLGKHEGLPCHIEAARVRLD